MFWGKKKETLPPSWEGKWFAPDGVNYRTIQGRAATKEEAVQLLSQRYQEHFGLDDGYTYFSVTQIKPEVKRERI